MTTQAKQQTRILVQAAAAVCEEKKGEETRILELDPVDAGLSDFFLVTSATNDRQAIAIADEIEHRLKKDFGASPTPWKAGAKASGSCSTTWILSSMYFSPSAAHSMTSRDCGSRPAR